jgi:hypothetical protein
MNTRIYEPYNGQERTCGATLVLAPRTGLAYLLGVDGRDHPCFARRDRCTRFWGNALQGGIDGVWEPRAAPYIRACPIAGKAARAQYAGQAEVAAWTAFLAADIPFAHDVTVPSPTLST